ncbi:MAG: pyridoxal phosphate-dependent aminotransferase [Thermoproteota archaeon]
MDTNENPYGASPKAIETYIKASKYINRYPDYGAFKEALSNHLGIGSSNVLPTPGSDRGLQVLLQHFSRIYRRVIIPSPAFLIYLRFSRLYFDAVKQVSCWLGRSWDSVFEHSGRDAVLIFGSPNNPTGEVVEEKLVEKMLGEFGAVIVDEAYVEYYGKSMLSLLRGFSNIVLARTFSKAYGLAGLRLGYLISSPEILRGVERFTGPFDVPFPAIEAARAALEDEEWLKKVVEATSANRFRMMRELSGMKDVEAYNSKANYVLIRIEEAEEAHRKLLERNIRVRLVTPEWGGVEECFLRVTVGTLAEIDCFLKAFREVYRN